MKTNRWAKLFSLVIIFSLFFMQAKSQEKQEDKITGSTEVLKDFGNMKESIPHEMLKAAEGIIIVPNLVDGGFVLAAKRGKGIAMVKFADGSWSNPVFVTITGGSVGLQAGVESVDLVLIFKQRKTLENIGKGSFTLNGDISATAGPVGRASTAGTDYKMQAEVYSYSRSKGLFAGISLSGSEIAVDSKANEAFYGKPESAKDLFSNSNENVTASVSDMKTELRDLYKN